MKHLAFFLILSFGAAAQQNSARKPSDYDERVAELEQRRAETPADADVLEALAGSYAMGARYADAIRITGELIALAPDNTDYRLRLVNLYTWSGQVDRALEELRKLNGRGGVDAIELECRLLTAKPDAKGAAACYARLRDAAAPGSDRQHAAELGMARNLSWSGQSAAAIHAYQAYNTAAPKDSTAALEFARLLTYQGRYSSAEAVVTAVLRNEPENVQALSLKAVILHWAGARAHEAAALSEHALAIHPDLPEARAAAVYALKDLGDVAAATAMFRALDRNVQTNGLDTQAAYAGAYEYLNQRVPQWSRIHIETPVSEYNDTDGIHESSRGVRVSLPAGNQSFTFTGQQFLASAPQSSIFGYPGGPQSVGVLSLGDSLHLGDNIQLTSSAGVALFGRGSSQAIFSAGFTGSPVDRWVFQLGADREIVPLTPKTIAKGLAYIAVHGGAEYYFNARTSMGLDAARAFWNDGNRSVRSSLHLQRSLRYASLFSIDAGPRVRMESFARDFTATSGIFTPDLYQCYEGYLGFHGEIRKRLIYDVRPAFGMQRITSALPFRTSSMVAASVKLELAGPLELSANYERRNYNLVTGNGSYQGFYLQLGLLP